MGAHKKKNCKGNLYEVAAGASAEAGGGASSLVGVLVKKSSDFFKYTPPIFTFCEIVRFCLGAKRLGMVFFRNFEGIFEIQNQSAAGNAEVQVN